MAWIDDLIWRLHELQCPKDRVAGSYDGKIVFGALNPAHRIPHSNTPSPGVCFDHFVDLLVRVRPDAGLAEKIVAYGFPMFSKLTVL